MARAKKRPSTLHMDADDSDDVYDEVDRFHMERNAVDVSEGNRMSKRTEEVLNVEGDLSDDQADDDGLIDSNLDSDTDSQTHNSADVVPSANKWGSKRADYYNTSYVDGDWGGMNESDEELAELEEEDALARQKKLDAAISAVHFPQEADEQEEEDEQEEKVDIEQLSEEDKLAFFLKKNSVVQMLIQDYSIRRQVLRSEVLPLLEIVKKVFQKRKTVLEEQLTTTANVLSSYLMNLMFFIRLKMTSNWNDDEENNYVDNHPVIEAIMAQQKMVKKVEDFLHENAASLSSIIDKAKGNEEDVGRILDESGLVEDIIGKKTRKEKEAAAQKEQEEEVEEQEWGVLDVDDSDGKRAITAQIEKNKGLATKRKRGTQHSRVKKRKQYDKALIKKRSQRPDTRRELVPYGGEKRGIRASTVKSIKLKA